MTPFSALVSLPFTTEEQGLKLEAESKPSLPGMIIGGYRYRYVRYRRV
jgi:hypothetical protein